MGLPDGRPLDLLDGVLLEPSEGSRVVLWVPGGRDGGHREWERVATVAHAEVATTRGVRSVAAATTPASQRLGGALGRLLRGIAGPGTGRAWALPGGGTAEGSGPRRADCALAWSEDASTPLDEARARARWPGCREARPVGRGLYLVSGIAAEGARPRPDPAPAAEPVPPEDSPLFVAGRALDAARGAGDERGAVAAAIDLGAAQLNGGDTHRAARLFKEALDGARRVGDPALEADALLNFALAAQTLGHSDRARDLLAPLAARARQSGDRYIEKLALDRLARALHALGDHAASIARLDEARVAAAATADRRHEADLLWRAAIQHAELGRRDRAIDAAGDAVGLLRMLGHPAAGWYAKHLADFRADMTGGQLVAPGGPASMPEVADDGLAAAGGPGLLRMAETALKAMAKFVGSGFKTTPAEALRARLAACEGCEHHTGVRCRACGCVTSAKARLLHERCPAGRWPA